MRDIPHESNGNPLQVRRGDIVIAVAPGELGKPRPMVVVQSDLFNPTHASVIVCPITSDLQDLPLFRLRIEATSASGLTVTSQVMADKVLAFGRKRITKVIGHAEAETMSRIEAALALCLQLPNPKRGSGQGAQ